jgi:CBS domain-containing protein
MCREVPARSVAVMPIDVPVPARLDLVPVRDVMHAGVISCPADTALVDIARILAAENVHCVVVADLETTAEGRRMTWGTVEAQDLVRALASAGGGRTAGDLATAPAATVAADESVSTALTAMVGAGVTHLVVEERGHPTGVISALDVARAAGGR